MLIIFFILGLVIGSFLNSVIYRLDPPAEASASPAGRSAQAGKKESIIRGRSHCPHCGKTLSWLELIPLMNFILQKGRCKHCGKKISWQYPIVELATGILFVLCAWYFFPNISAYGGPAAGWQFLISIIFWLLVISCLIVIFVYDLKHYIIPNQVIYPAIVLAFGFRILNLFRISNFEFRILEKFNPFIAAFSAGAFFLILILVSKGKWMGMGDFKLAIFMGLVLGWPKILVALFGAFLAGAFASIILIILKKKTIKSEIPFGPFLAGATILTLFIGDKLIAWYLGLLF